MSAALSPASPPETAGDRENADNTLFFVTVGNRPDKRSAAPSSASPPQMTGEPRENAGGSLASVGGRSEKVSAVLSPALRQRCASGDDDDDEAAAGDDSETERTRAAPSPASAAEARRWARHSRLRRHGR